LKKYTVFTFRAEVAVLRIGRICVGIEEGKAERADLQRQGMKAIGPGQ
jgi:hypothetical protein